MVPLESQRIAVFCGRRGKKPIVLVGRRFCYRSPGTWLKGHLPAVTEQSGSQFRVETVPI